MPVFAREFAATEREGLGGGLSIMSTTVMSTPMTSTVIAVDVASTDVIKAFQSIDRDIEGQSVLVEKCIDICKKCGVSAMDLVDHVEVVMDNGGIKAEDLPTIQQLMQAEKNLAKKASDSSRKASPGLSSCKVFTKESSNQLSAGLSSFTATYGVQLQAPVVLQPQLMTPAKRSRGADTPNSRGPASSRQRILPHTPPPATPAVNFETPETVKYANRLEKFEVTSTFNEALPAANVAERRSTPRCEIVPLKSALLGDIREKGKQLNFSFMYEKVEHKFCAMRERLKALTDQIVANHKLKERAEAHGEDFALARVNQVSQDLVWFCGRICAEGDTASMNESSVMLEGVNGRRVKLDLANVGEFAVFPGQIVVVRGSNSTSECITVREIFTDASLPMMRTPAGKIASYNESVAFLGGEPLSLLVASGPFTSSAELGFEPLEDLMAHVRQTAPDVLILVGPFVDARHKLLDPAQAGTPGGFSNGDPPDSLQAPPPTCRIPLPFATARHSSRR